MTVQKGFTLFETLVVLIILGVVVAFLLPNLIVSVEKSKAQTAKNNLLAISAAQTKYYEDNSKYCIANCTTIASIDQHLLLTIASNDPFSYSCFVGAVGMGCTQPYYCTATANDGSVTLTLNVIQSASPACTVIGANVSCTAGGVYCPS